MSGILYWTIPFIQVAMKWHNIHMVSACTRTTLSHKTTACNLIAFSIKSRHLRVSIVFIAECLLLCLCTLRYLYSSFTLVVCVMSCCKNRKSMQANELHTILVIKYILSLNSFSFSYSHFLSSTHSTYAYRINWNDNMSMYNFSFSLYVFSFSDNNHLDWHIFFALYENKKESSKP